MTNTYLAIAQIALAAITVVFILIQRRGSGLSSAFGGSSGSYATRRGAEKAVFIGTIVGAILFFAVSIARILLLSVK